MMSTSMRGLTNFISDVRNCQNKEIEKKRVDKELAHIRERFLKDASMKGYDRKKYVSKLLYIQMLGYNFDFGHMEAVNLLSSLKYSEKQIGYLACGLMLHEDDDIARLIINSIQKDLVTRNELWQCLALAIIANLGGREMAETLHSIIEKLVVTSGSPQVRKRAAISLLRLYRKFPDIFSPEEWRDKVVHVLEERDMTVLTATCSLLVGLISQSGTAGYEGVVPRCIKLMQKIVIAKEYPPEYVYYGVPNPWLQYKCLRLLQFFPQPEDAGQRAAIREVLVKVLNTTEPAKNVNRNNAAHCVLFEAINLIIHYQSDRELLTQAATMLGRFLSMREANIRYLGLEAMSRLATVLEDTGEHMRRHQTTVFSSLRETDISIRKAALNMLYGMCDRTNAQEVVSELLDYLNNAEYAIREELVLKIAILAERFATDLSWYIDVMLVLIQQAGDFVAQDVWWRVVQIVTNNPDLHAYAAKTVFQAMQQAVVGETMIKAAGYILGEFGGAVGDISTSQQFETLHARFGTASPTTRELLLTSYLKMAARDSSVRGRVEEVLRAHSDSLDVELQQRACEYLLLAQRAGTALVGKVLEKMPAFPERESSLLRIIKQRQAAATDKIPRADATEQQPTEAAEPVELAVAASAPRGGASAPAASQDLMGDLLGGGGSAAPSASGGAAAEILALLSGGGAAMGAVANQAQYRQLELAPEGVLFDDGALHIAIKTEYHGNLGRMMLQYTNRSGAPMTGFAAGVATTVSIKIQAAPIPNVLPPGQSVGQMVAVECLQPFRDAPNMQINYNGKSVTIKLPVAITKFLEPFRTTGPEFFKRWNQIMPNTPQEMQATFQYPRPITPDTVAEMASRMSGFKLAVLEKLDPNPMNLVCAGLLITSASQSHILVRVETAPAQQMLRLTVRSMNEVVVPSVGEIFKAHLSY